MLSVTVLGASGRVGKRLIGHLLRDERYALCAAFVRTDSPHLGADAGALAGEEACGIMLEAVRPCDADVVIDFSLPSGLEAWLALAQAKPLVTGTTGLSQQTTEALQQHAIRAPVVAASNFSEGVALLRALVTTAAQRLDGWDVEIVETHHQAKRDAPSGTAEALLSDLTRARSTSSIQHGRLGAVGPRDPSEIGVHSVRAGTVHGVHDVLFAGPGEELSLKHTATSRDVFVLGALSAARWIVSQPNGRYDMPDVLGL